MGDVVSVELRLDLAPRTLPVPPDLRAGLKDHPKAWKAFEALASGHRRQFIRWYDSAKPLKPATVASIEPSTYSWNAHSSHPGRANS